MNFYLDKVFKWLTLNKLNLNLSKTVYITFRIYINSIPKNVNIYLNNAELSNVEYTKYLGVYFDQHMRWDMHVNSVVKKTRYLIFVFRKLKKYMLIKSLLTIYYALFNSIASYGILSWGGAYDNVLNSLQSIQDRILKIIACNEITKRPLNMTEKFKLESLYYYYNELREKYKDVKVNTRYKNLDFKVSKAVLYKCSYTTAMKVYNTLSNEFKYIIYGRNKKYLKSKLRTVLNIINLN